MNKLNIVSQQIGKVTVHVVECNKKDIIILRPRGKDDARLIGPMALELGTAPRYLYLNSNVTNNRILAAVAALNKETELTGEIDMMVEISIDAAIEALNPADSS